MTFYIMLYQCRCMQIQVFTNIDHNGLSNLINNGKAKSLKVYKRISLNLCIFVMYIFVRLQLRAAFEFHFWEEFWTTQRRNVFPETDDDTLINYPVLNKQEIGNPVDVSFRIAAEWKWKPSHFFFFSQHKRDNGFQSPASNCPRIQSGFSKLYTGM